MLLTEPEAAMLEAFIAPARATVLPQAWNAELAAGRALSQPEALALLLSLSPARRELAPLLGGACGFANVSGDSRSARLTPGVVAAPGRESPHDVHDVCKRRPTQEHVLPGMGGW